jgi:hypothetical protein
MYHPIPPSPPPYPPSASQPIPQPMYPPPSPPTMYPQPSPDDRHCACRNECDEYGADCRKICSCEEIEIVKKSNIIAPE